MTQTTNLLNDSVMGPRIVANRQHATKDRFCGARLATASTATAALDAALRNAGGCVGEANVLELSGNAAARGPVDDGAAQSRMPVSRRA